MTNEFEGDVKYPLSKLFNAQIAFQKEVAELDIPVDSPKWFAYHITAMQEELGEVLKADKRWKTHRNTTYIPQEKLEELADVFITAINLAIFSGFNVADIYSEIASKIEINTAKLKKSRE